MKKLTILFIIATIAPTLYAEELYIAVTSVEKIPVISTQQEQSVNSIEKDDFETLLDEEESHVIVHEMRPISWIEAQLQRISLAIILPLYSVKNWCSIKCAACIAYLTALYTKQ